MDTVQCNAMRCNPILNVDPKGALDNEYEVDGKTGARTKVSDLGGDEVDYNHIKGGSNDGKTEIVDMSTCKTTIMSTSNFVKGYTHRDSKTDWKNIYDEFITGTGPEKSLISGRDNQMIQDIMKSPQFATGAQKFMENGTDKKLFF